MQDPVSVACLTVHRCSARSRQSQSSCGGAGFALGGFGLPHQRARPQRESWAKWRARGGVPLIKPSEPGKNARGLFQKVGADIARLAVDFDMRPCAAVNHLDHIDLGADFQCGEFGGIACRR